LHSYNDEPALIAWGYGNSCRYIKQWMKCGKLHRETKTPNGFLNPALVHQGDCQPVFEWHINGRNRDEYIEIDGYRVRLPDKTTTMTRNLTAYTESFIRPLVAINEHILREFGHYIPWCTKEFDCPICNDCKSGCPYVYSYRKYNKYLSLVFESPSYYNGIKLPEVCYSYI
jgi:hypothetical protein